MDLDAAEFNWLKSNFQPLVATWGYECGGYDGTGGFESLLHDPAVSCYYYLTPYTDVLFRNLARVCRGDSHLFYSDTFDKFYLAAVSLAESRQMVSAQKLIHEFLEMGSMRDLISNLARKPYEYKQDHWAMNSLVAAANCILYIDIGAFDMARCCANRFMKYYNRTHLPSSTD